MATLYTHQSQNVAKTWVLMTLFFAVVIGVGWAISFYYNNPGILLFAVVFAVVMNITSYWFSDKIVVKMAGAKPADGPEYLELNRLVENLAITAGLPIVPGMSTTDYFVTCPLGNSTFHGHSVSVIPVYRNRRLKWMTSEKSNG